MQSRKYFTVMVALLACATKISSDIYTPALLIMAKELPGASIDVVQLSFSVFLLGVAISQLFFGPLSEGIGRKRPLLIGLMIMGFGSVLCASAMSISGLFGGRFVQGLGSGALYALWRAMLRDVFQGEDLAKQSASLFVFMVGWCSMAPVIGGYMALLNWRGCFWFMAAYTLISAALIAWRYEESNSHCCRDKLQRSYIKRTYARLLGDPLFVGLAICMFLSFSSVFAWLVVAPVLLMHKLGMSTTSFGWVIAGTATSGFACGAMINNRYVSIIGMPQMMQWGWGVMSMAGLCMCIGFYVGGISCPAILLPILLFNMGSTMVWPNAFAIAFTPYGHIAGYAGSVYGVIQLGGGAVIGAVVAQLPDMDQRPLGVVLVLASLCALGIYRRWLHPRVIMNQQSA